MNITTAVVLATVVSVPVPVPVLPVVVDLLPVVYILASSSTVLFNCYDTTSSY